MLKRLTIDNYALIDHLEITFPGDLVIITGETGAGKSILLGALSLLLGGKADGSVVKDAGRNCIVEAEFEDEGRELFVRRILSSSGRSRSFVDDEPVALETLRSVASLLVDIHSQNQQLQLSERDFCLSVVDAYSSVGEQVKEYMKLYDSLCSSEKQLVDKQEEAASLEKEREYLEFQYEKLNQAALEQGELEKLEIEQAQLANSESIKESLSSASSIFDGNDTALESRLKEIETSLARAARYVPEATELSQRVASSRIELKDVAQEVERLCEKVVYSPERLEEVDRRIALLYDLMRKHNVSSVDELIVLRDEMATRLGIGADVQTEIESLKKRCEELRTRCEAAAESIHDIRQKMAGPLAGEIQDLVRSLEMPMARFEVKLQKKASLGRDGEDDVTFLFDANNGRLKELSKCASGGEMSRIMLCIKHLMSKHTGMPTMIFDEIDTGVSGSIADKMGRMIVSMGSSMQVLAITHLPQVASKGSAHYLVYKTGDPVQTNIRQIEGEDRVREIARMLSGSSLSQEALANARVLLNESNK